MAEQDRSGPDRDAAPRGRGRLRIYLGAAPGVGKTFAMLDEGWRRARRGTDVVVGYVETHGRPNTAAQLRDLEVVPRRQIVYRGQTFEEMDLPAVLARAPQVVLVDELAHTNVPGSEHDKRIADVQDLLAAGIDVVTTLNVQHLESVNDVVEKITGIAQLETVPDAVVRSADQVELVDMDPEALRRRMAHGNIYVRVRSTPPWATTSGWATSPPCGSSPCCGSPTGSTSRCRTTWTSTASRAPGRPGSGWSWPSPARPAASD